MKLGEMTLADFVKAGWSAQDVKELLGASQIDTEPQDTTPAEHVQTQIDNEPQDITQAEHVQTQIETDLQNELNNMKEELLRTQKALANAQAMNRSQNFGDKNNKSDYDIFSDFVKSY